MSALYIVWPALTIQHFYHSSRVELNAGQEGRRRRRRRRMRKVGGGTQPTHQSGECGVGGRVRVAGWGSVVMSSDAWSDG